MMYSTERNEVINFLNNNGLSSEVALFNDLFDALENASFKTSYMKKQLDKAVTDIRKNIAVFKTPAPTNVKNIKLSIVKNKLLDIRDKFPVQDKEVLQNIERIKIKVKSVILDHIGNVESKYSVNLGSANRHTKGVDTGLATELALKNLYAILHLNELVDANYEKLIGLNTPLEFHNTFPLMMDDCWYGISKSLDSSLESQIQSQLNAVKNGKSSPLYDSNNPLTRDDILDCDVKINGHNTLTLLSVMPEKIQTLIKYQILVRLTKDIDENIKLPDFDKFITVHDFMLLIKNFDSITYQDLFKVIQTNLAMYSNDFDGKRYGLDLISENNYRFNLAFFTASYIALMHEYENLDKYTCVLASELDDASLKTASDVLVVPKEYESIMSVYSRSLDDLIKNNSDKKTLLDNLLNKSYFDWLLGLNKYNFYTLISKFNENEIEWLYNQNNTNKNNFEDTLYYFTYLKSYLKGLDLDLTDKNVERVSKFVELVNSTNDLSYLELQYNNWLGSIKIEDFTMEELDILEKFDPNYISGISNYSLKSYHYVCKKVNADFKGDVNIVGSRTAKHKAALYQYFADLGYSDIPSYLKKVDLYSALNVIKFIEDAGYDFEDIPRYYFRKDSNEMFQMECIVLSLIDNRVNPLQIPEHFLPKDEKESHDLSYIIEICNELKIDVFSILNSEKFADFNIEELNGLLSAYLSIFNDTNILDLPDDVIKDDYPVELCLLAYKFTCDVDELPHYYANQDYGALHELMKLYAENGLDVRTIPVHFIHFYYDGFTGKLKEMLDEGKKINSIELSFFIDNSYSASKIGSYFIYLASQIGGYINSSIMTKAYYAHKTANIKDSIPMSVILLTFIDTLMRGMNVDSLTILEFNNFKTLLKKYTYLSDNVLGELIKTYNKGNYTQMNLNVLSDSYRYKKFTDEQINEIKNKKLINNTTLFESRAPINVIRNLMVALGYTDIAINEFIKNKQIITSYNCMDHIISILNAYIDQGLTFDKIPEYLNLLNFNNTDIRHLDRVVKLFQKNNYSLKDIPYYYLFDASGNAFNGIYTLNVFNILNMFDELDFDYSEIPYRMINNTSAKVKSLLKLMKQYNIGIDKIPPSYFAQSIGRAELKLFDYFHEKGVEMFNIPDRFISKGPNSLIILKLYESIGISWEEVNDKLLNVDIDYLKQFIALGIDPRTVTDNQLKYGYYAAQYVDYVNSLDIEDGMVYLSQEDIAESFNMINDYNTMYSLEELYSSKELLYKTTREIVDIITLAKEHNDPIDLRMLYMPMEFIRKYFIFAIEYFKQYDGDMDYDKAYEVAKSISYRADVIPEDMLDLDDESPTYTPAKVINEMLYVKRGRAFR